MLWVFSSIKGPVVTKQEEISWYIQELAYMQNLVRAEEMEKFLREASLSVRWEIRHL